MMDTPILDFVRSYRQKQALRLHMPGHKGKGFLGFEELDITEIDGADSLYEARGIIRQSQENASRLFGCPTFYSTEGCSQCIRAMVYLAMLAAKNQGKRPWIAAARNIHKTFLSAAALLDVDVTWLYGKQQDSYLSCRLTPEDLTEFFAAAQEKPTAVYITSPDYLGNTQDVAALAKVCHEHDCLLLVDNAHGSYLRFLQPSRHPMDLGADICCDSAHKTLPVLTGGAYLHIALHLEELCCQASNALMLFGSTSPSYLILQSLDSANAYLAEGYEPRLAQLVAQLQKAKESLQNHGYTLHGDEPLKLTIAPKSYGYTGRELADLLLAQDMVCEFSDPDFTVMMLTPENGQDTLDRLVAALLNIPQKPAITQAPPCFRPCQRALSVREAALSPSRYISTEESLGKVLSSPCVGCPPAVPMVVCGEVIDRDTLEGFAYYGIQGCFVIP